MNLTNTKLILNQLNVYPRKHLGQNFLVDENIAAKVISESDISDKDTILEIGSGLGSLTEKLAQNARKVYAVEIEPRFCSYLTDKFSFTENIEIINGDILEIELPNFNKVVANIPYSITGPIFEKIFFQSNPPHGIMIVQKDIAERIFLQEKLNAVSRITITVNSFMCPIKSLDVPRSSFYPRPNIDLALIKLHPLENTNPLLRNAKFRKFYLKFIAGIMPYKNKDLKKALFFYIRNLSDIHLTKEKLSAILIQNNFSNRKLFTLSINEFLTISNILFNLKSMPKSDLNSTYPRS